MKVWFVRAEFGTYAEHFKNGGYMALDYGIGEEFPADAVREDFVKLFKKYHPEEESNIVVGQQAGQLLRFAREIKAGDYIITPTSDSNILNYGQVLDSPYYFEANPGDGCPYRHRRQVKWSSKTVRRGNYSVPFQNTIKSSLTVFRVSHASEFLASIGAEGFEHDPDVEAYDSYKSVLDKILLLDPSEFEFLVRELLSAIGFEATEVTGGPHDGGVDATGILNLHNIAKVKIFVQVKRYNHDSRITAGTVKQLRAAIPNGGQGAFVTTAQFQRGAHDIANDPGFPRIGLVNGKQLVDLLVEHWDDIPEEFQDKLALKRGLVPV